MNTNVFSAHIQIQQSVFPSSTSNTLIPAADAPAADADAPAVVAVVPAAIAEAPAADVPAPDAVAEAPAAVAVAGSNGLIALGLTR